MKIITLDDVKLIIKQHTFNQVMLDLMEYVREDFKNWESFSKSSRHVIHVDGGVEELMPVANDKLYTFKYVNGHPKNPKNNKLTIVATGQIARVEDGYPLLYSEMTLLTALRTAATSAIATNALARGNIQTLGLIGTGAQSEFQLLATLLVRTSIKTVKFYDTDPKAMQKFERNIQAKNLGIELIPCTNYQETVIDNDLIITCIAEKAHVELIKGDWVKPGTHINGIGGDCPGKTELAKDVLLKSKIVVEYLPQSSIEGEIQQLEPEQVSTLVKAELWEVISGKKPVRNNDDDITLFDSVGFALEDFSVLRLIQDLAIKYNIGQELNMVPNLSDTKNLISLIS